MIRMVQSEHGGAVHAFLHIWKNFSFVLFLSLSVQRHPLNAKAVEFPDYFLSYSSSHKSVSKFYRERIFFFWLDMRQI